MASRSQLKNFSVGFSLFALPLRTSNCPLEAAKASGISSCPKISLKHIKPYQNRSQGMAGVADSNQTLLRQVQAEPNPQALLPFRPHHKSEKSKKDRKGDESALRCLRSIPEPLATTAPPRSLLPPRCHAPPAARAAPLPGRSPSP